MLVADGLEWLQVYYVNGETPRGARFRSEVKDPPNGGWSLAFILPGEKRSVIFCPFTFQSWQVSNGSAEVAQAVEPRDEYRQAHMAEKLKAKWEELQSFGFTRDYDTAALVFKKLGLPIPAYTLNRDGTEDTKERGGKTVEAVLKKPVKRKGRRGEVLAWFMDTGEDGRPRSVREAMVVFDTTRSNILSVLYLLQKDHGIGYSLVGDSAAIILPEGVTDPFEPEAQS